MNIAVCVKQIPDPAVPGKLDADHTLNRDGQAASSTTPTATASRWRCSSPTRRAAARSSSSRWRPTARCRACAPRSPWARPARCSCPTTRSPAPTRCRRRRCSPRRSSAPATSTSCSPRPSRPTATPARSRRRSRSCSAGRRSRSPSTSRSATARSRIQRQTEAGYDVVEASLPAVVSVTAGVVEPALPVVQGDHGGEEQAGRPGDRRPTSASSADDVGWAGARQTDRVRRRRARAARPARRSRTTARRTSASSRSSSSSRSSDGSETSRRREDSMAVSKIWVFAEADGDKPTTPTLELLTKARELGDTRRGGARRRRRRRARAGGSASTARPRCTRSTPATRCPASSARPRSRR